jgi:hypothetical protein
VVDGAVSVVDGAVKVDDGAVKDLDGAAKMLIGRDSLCSNLVFSPGMPVERLVAP